MVTMALQTENQPPKFANAIHLWADSFCHPTGCKGLQKLAGIYFFCVIDRLSSKRTLLQYVPDCAPLGRYLLETKISRLTNYRREIFHSIIHL